MSLARSPYYKRADKAKAPCSSALNLETRSGLAGLALFRIPIREACAITQSTTARLVLMELGDEFPNPLPSR
jgi:hypothetical protein